MMLRTLICDVCGCEQKEQASNQGWAGWGALHGVALDGVANPSLCPACLTKVAKFIDGVKHGMD